MEKYGICGDTEETLANSDKERERGIDATDRPAGGEIEPRSSILLGRDVTNNLTHNSLYRP